MKGIYPDSSLWLDQPDAIAQIEARQRDQGITESEAQKLRQFASEGYFTVSIDLSPQDRDGLLRDVDNLWQTRPDDVAYASGGPAMRMSQANTIERRPGSRLHDLHSHSLGALEIYLNRDVIRWAGLLLDETPIAFQSLFFEFGSEQVTHRDPIVVPVYEPGHLVAVWIALETIHPDSGPLQFVPGSHRLPYYELTRGEYRLLGPVPSDTIERGLAWEQAQFREHGLHRESFLGRSGQALFWHASLAHGGSVVTDPSRTRRSFVTHFSSARTYGARGIGIVDSDGGAPQQHRAFSTTKRVQLGSRIGMANPLCPYRTP